jgi:hypothetical protein
LEVISNSQSIGKVKEASVVAVMAHRQPAKVAEPANRAIVRSTISGAGVSADH